MNLKPTPVFLAFASLLYAVPSLAYEERIIATALGLSDVMASAPHSGFNEYATLAGVFTMAATGVAGPSISFESGQIPSDSGKGSYTYTGDLSYSFNITGAQAYSTIGLGFLGHVELYAKSINENNNMGQLTTNIQASFHVASSKTNFVTGSLGVSADSGKCNCGNVFGSLMLPVNDPIAPYSQPWTFTGTTSATGTYSHEFIKGLGRGFVSFGNAENINWLDGNFSGTFLIQTDANGNAQGKATIALTSAAPLVGHGLFGETAGYIDPYLYIAPEFLSSNPQATLSIESGVDNTPPIPEPESYAMFMAGLGLLGFVMRAKMHS